MSDSLKIVNCEGDAGIEQVKTLKATLLEFLRQKNSVIVNFSRCDKADLSTVQVVVSAKKYALSKGLQIQFANTVSDQVLEAFYLAGICPKEAKTGKDVDRFLDELVSPKV